MCLADIQLARGAQMTITPVVFAGAATQQILQPSKDRVGFVILGPTTGNLDIRIGDQTAQYTAQRILVTSSVDIRRFMLTEYGQLVTLGVWATESAAATLIVVEYTLPMRRDQLGDLAQTGNF